MKKPNPSFFHGKIKTNSHIGMDENVIYCDYELNPETVEGLSPAENDNNPTMEIYGRMTSCFITICWTNNRAKL